MESVQQSSDDTSVQTVQFPGARDSRCPFNPPPHLSPTQASRRPAKARTWDGAEPWLITQHELACTALRDQSFSSDPRNQGWAEKSASFSATMGADRNLRTMDNPEHAAQRRMLAPEFTIGRISQMRSSIEALVDRHINAMLHTGGTVDLVEAYTLPVPLLVLCELMGIPESDSPLLAAISEETIGDNSYEVAAEAGQRLSNYIREFISHRDRIPDGSLVARLLDQHVSTGNMTEDELVDLMRLFIVAGHETTANQLGLSFLALLSDPDLMEEMRRAVAEGYLANAVEELLRFMSVSHLGRRRVAVADTSIGDQVIRAGEPIIVANSTADRDPAVYENPDVIDFTRPNAKRHLAFGFGVHQCLGQHLSRLELAVAIPRLLERVPGLRLAVSPDEVVFKENHAVYGVRSLPVTWS